jgi:hypothetical protein
MACRLSRSHREAPNGQRQASSWQKLLQRKRSPVFLDDGRGYCVVSSVALNCTSPAVEDRPARTACEIGLGKLRDTLPLLRAPSVEAGESRMRNSFRSKVKNFRFV